MALKVEWTKEAKHTFREILAYLEKNWSEKEVKLQSSSVLTRMFLRAASVTRYVRMMTLGW